MTGSILLKGGLVIRPVPPGSGSKNGSSALKRLDVRMNNGVISELAEDLERHSEDTVLSVRDLYISPGFIDTHTHLRDLNESAKETIETGTRAAAAGGYTTIVAMANTDPPTDSPRILALTLDKIRTSAQVRVLPLAAVTLGLKGEQLTEMAQLAEMGAVAFSDDHTSINNLALLSRALRFAKLLDKTIISHSEDKDLSQGGCLNESHVSTRLGLEGIPSVAETASVAREIEVVRATGGRLHFAHVSTEGAVALIKRAKADGLKITAAVTPHHICLSDDDILDFDTRFKTSPPLRSKSDQEALIAAVKEGIFDAIACDHSPHSRHEKAQSFAHAPFGIVGLETSFALVHERLVKQKLISINELIYLLTKGPAKVLGLTEPEIVLGARADVTVIDPNHTWTYQSVKGFSRSHNSPFDGTMLSGKAMATIADGKIVFQEQSRLTAK